MHVLAHGTAAATALALAAARRDALASLVLASPITNAADASLSEARAALATGRAGALLVTGVGATVRRLPSGTLSQSIMSGDEDSCAHDQSLIAMLAGAASSR